jgi:hypothetical protein
MVPNANFLELPARWFAHTVADAFAGNGPVNDREIA